MRSAEDRKRLLIRRCLSTADWPGRRERSTSRVVRPSGRAEMARWEPKGLPPDWEMSRPNEWRSMKSWSVGKSSTANAFGTYMRTLRGVGFAARDARTRRRVQVAMCIHDSNGTPDHLRPARPHPDQRRRLVPDGRRIVYDVRSDPAGDVFDGDRIETVDVETGEVRVLYESTQRGEVRGRDLPARPRTASCSSSARSTRRRTSATAPARRRGVMVDEARPGVAIPLDARDLSRRSPPGPCAAGRTSTSARPTAASSASPTRITSWRRAPANRISGTSASAYSVDRWRCRRVPPRNHDGAAFSVLVTRTVGSPDPGLGRDFARRSRTPGSGPTAIGRPRAIAFQGHVVTPSGDTISEVFVVDLPDDLTVPGDGPLEGTATTRPRPPKGTVQRRLTYTADRRYPGIQGPRHWLRSSPDGSRIAFLMRDDRGIVQLWTVSPNGGEPVQVTPTPPTSRRPSPGARTGVRSLT